MKIVNDFPPNIAAIAKKFPIHGFNPVFTYGDTLYNPSGGPISDDLMAHEQTHERQQQAIGVEQWWAMYLEDETFRLTQETEAYRAQYKAVQDKPRNWRRLFLQAIARDLSSKLYGSIINTKQAKELIHGQ